MNGPGAFRRSIALTSLAVAFAAWTTWTAAASDAPPATTDAAALSKARATGTKKRAERKFYEPQFDLSGLPEYKPQQIVSGTIRQWGNNYIKDSPLVDVWESGFRKYHPDIRFKDNLSSSAVAFPGLIAGVGAFPCAARNTT